MGQVEYTYTCIVQPLCSELVSSAQGRARLQSAVRPDTKACMYGPRPPMVQLTVS